MAKNLSDNNENLVVGLDLGSTKTCVLVAEALPSGGLNVIGVGNAPSVGLRKGVVVNIEATVESIQKAVAEAERMAGVSVKSAFVSVGGEHIKGLTSHGVIAVSRKDKEITQEDVDRVIEAAKAVPIPQDREIIHVLTQEFLIDNQDGIREPVGMSGVRLEAVVHIVTGAVTSVQNILKSCERAGITVEDLVLQPLASAEAVLTADERELGVALIDIGGGTTDLLIHWESAVRHTGVVPVGGNQCTRDLAIGLKTANEEAEAIKRRYGAARVDMVPEGQVIDVAGVGGRPPRSEDRRLVPMVLQPRMEELFTLVGAELKKSGFDSRLAAGVVLTGGGSLLEGSVPLAEEILGQSARLGKPQGLSGLVDVVQGPEYATAVGLVRHGARQRHEGSAAPRPGVSKVGAASGAGVFEMLKRFFKDYF